MWRRTLLRPMSDLAGVQRAHPSPDKTVFRRRSILLTILSIDIAILIVPGIGLWPTYRATDLSWRYLLTESDDWDGPLRYELRLLHPLAS